MKKTVTRFAYLVMMLLFYASCNGYKGKSDSRVSSIVKTETINYSSDTITMCGFVACDSSNKEKRPVIMVVPEWWGLNDYAKSRAIQLAALGYLAMVVDLYGNGRIVATPDTAEMLSTPFYSNPLMAKKRFDAAIARIKTYPQADTTKIAAIGYCFGGAQVVNIANLGAGLKGVVCFHGNVIAGTPVEKQLLKAKILVCSGAADEFVKMDEIELFKKRMDSIGAGYSIKIYASAMHSFTNPEATAIGKKFNLPIAYNHTADSASWQDMKLFLTSIFK